MGKVAARKATPKKAVPKASKAKPAPKKKVVKKKAVIKKPPVKKVAKKPFKSPAPKVRPAPAPKKKKAAPSGPKGYTPDEYTNFQAHVRAFNGKSNQALKDLLRKNLQSMSGNKDELVYKCADGATLGRIPRCPNCFGGRPKFDHKKGTYYCSGYRDDTDFHNCHSTFQKGDLKRDTWDN